MATKAIKLDPEVAAVYGAASRMTRSPLVDGSELQDIYDVFLRALLGPGVTPDTRELARWVLIRIGAYELAEKFCDFSTFGTWVLGSANPIFLQQLARVRGHVDRLALLEQHAEWAHAFEARIDRPANLTSPVRRPGAQRIGLISTGLDQIVGQFCAPLVAHRPEEVELFVYALSTPTVPSRSEQVQRLSKFRRLPLADPAEAARIIAADDLDLLIELDGLSGAHALHIMALRPARRQASWLGYPHSTGLSTIDHVIVDPHLGSSHLLEKPIVLPNSWIGLPPSKFTDSHSINPVIPELRKGFLTFGTLNNPYKFTLESIRTWARIVAACPGSKFLFVRPECSAPSFRRGMIKRFASEGVSEDRLLFDSTTGLHMPMYNQIDISLDTFPLTGGTTTAEALWMGVPVISLVGEAIFERLSYSLLMNAGLPELAVETIEDYQLAAIALAQAPERRIELRTFLRDFIKTTALGDPARFAKEFYAATMIASQA